MYGSSVSNKRVVGHLVDHYLPVRYGTIALLDPRTNLNNKEDHDTNR